MCFANTKINSDFVIPSALRCGGLCISSFLLFPPAKAQQKTTRLAQN